MKKKKVAIDARFVLRKQRGMPLYTFMLCKLIPKILYQHQFVLFINKGFEHNDSAEKYQVRLDEICKLDNVEIVNADADSNTNFLFFTLSISRILPLKKCFRSLCSI